MAKLDEPTKNSVTQTTGAESIAALRDHSSRSVIGFIAFALFVTTFCQTGQLAKLPLQFILKDELFLKANEMAFFLAIILLPWYAKPIAGILSDNFPLNGSRRRNYLILSSLLAAMCWTLMAIVPRGFGTLLVVGLAVNCMIVIANTVVGGLIVFEGRLYGITGRLASIRVFVKNGAMLLAGPIGGLLATFAFGWTAATAAACYILLTVLTLLKLKEDKTPEKARGLSVVWTELKRTGKSPGLLIAAGMVFLFHIEPGFGTPLFYFQTQTLQFTSTFIGVLAILYGIFALAAAAIYMRVCRHINLRTLLIYSIICTAATTLPYLAYHSRTSAIWIEMIAGFGAGLAQLPLFDLAGRATPKGSESLGYALLMSMWNLGMSVSDMLGSWLYDHFQLGFQNLIWLNAGTTLLCLFAVPLIPASLIRGREGESHSGSPE